MRVRKSGLSLWKKRMKSCRNGLHLLFLRRTSNEDCMIQQSMRLASPFVRQL
jgi:hypothetical protein